MAPSQILFAFLAFCQEKVTMVAQKLISGLDLEGLDLTTSPREDFYQYCNGNWTEEIPADRATWGTFPSIREDTTKNVHSLVDDIAKNCNRDLSSEEGKISVFWRAAMDTERIETEGLGPLNDIFEDIDAVINKQDYIKMVAHLHRLNIGIVFACGAEADMKDSDSTILWIGEGALGLGPREYYYDEDKEPKRKAYVAHIEKVFSLAGFSDAKTAAQEVMAVEMGLAEVSKTNVEKRDFAAMYNPVTLEDLDEAWDWKTYFDIAGAECLSMDESKLFCVANLKHFVYACSAVTDENVGQWKQYAKWHTLKQFVKFMPDDFVKANFDFFSRELTGQTEIMARWKQMLHFIDASIGELLGQVYCNRFFPQSSKDAMLELVDNTIISLHEMIDNDLPWMSDSTRASAIKKLSNVSVKIGYPDKFVDYTTFTPTPDDNIISIVRKIFEFEHVRDWNQANKPTNWDTWSMPPQMVNAYYNPMRNEIAFPAGILQGAAFSPDRDLCANYGAIGAVIGHELTHGFDDKGKCFNWKGNIENWWTDTDLERYNSRKQPIIDQYSAIEVLPGQFINGELTQGENIADIGGLKSSYRAMKAALKSHPESDQVIDGYTPDQRFFIAWAQFWRTKSRDDELMQRLASDPHSPGRIRAYLPPCNLDEFVEAFSVVEGDKMYVPKEKRGQVW
eukprot:CFRG7458T1